MSNAGGSDERELKDDLEHCPVATNGHSEPKSAPAINGQLQDALASAVRVIAATANDPMADEAHHMRVVANQRSELAEAADKLGINSGSVDGILKAAMRAEPAIRDVWLDDGIEGMVAKAIEAGEAPPPARPSDGEAEKWKFVDAGELAGVRIELTRWVVVNRLPVLELVLLTGDGAAGKTTIALQLGVAVAHVKPGITLDWLGAEIQERGPVLVFTGEERLKMMHSRLDAILKHHKLSYGDVAGRLKFLCLPEDDATLGRVTQAGKVEPTSLFAWMIEQVKAIKPKLVIIEAVVDVLDGEDFKRRAVRQFLKQLRQLTVAGEGSVLLIGHPSVAGIQSGSELSGSTDWHNAVRGRMYFTSAKKNGDDADPNARELQILKNQFGPPGEVVHLVWKDRVYIKPSSASPIERAVIENEVDTLFVKLIREQAAR